jgi:hypothetical protein
LQQHFKFYDDCTPFHLDYSLSVMSLPSLHSLIPTCDSWCFPWVPFFEHLPLRCTKPTPPPPCFACSFLRSIRLLLHQSPRSASTTAHLYPRLSGAATHPLNPSFVGAAALVIPPPYRFEIAKVLFVDYITLSAFPMPSLEYTPALLVFFCCSKNSLITSKALTVIEDIICGIYIIPDLAQRVRLGGIGIRTRLTKRLRHGEVVLCLIP